jgi:hypothetical protein
MGLLDNRRVAGLLADKVRRRSAGQALKKVLDEIRSVPGEPLTMDEIGAEIKAFPGCYAGLVCCALPARTHGQSARSTKVQTPVLMGGN